MYDHNNSRALATGGVYGTGTRFDHTRPRGPCMVESGACAINQENIHSTPPNKIVSKTTQCAFYYEMFSFTEHKQINKTQIWCTTANY